MKSSESQVVAHFVSIFTLTLTYLGLGVGRGDDAAEVGVETGVG